MRIFLFLFIGFFLCTSVSAQKRKKKKKTKAPAKMDTLATVDAKNSNIQYLTILKNDIKESTGKMVDNQKEGFWKTYHTGGEMSSLSEYQKGKLIGVTVNFNKDGKGISQINHQFVNDTIVKQDDLIPTLQHYTIYNDIGWLSQTGDMLDNQKTGVWRDFHPNGNVAKMTTYKGGKRNGITYIFDLDGGIEEETSYENEQLSGRKITYMLMGKGKNRSYRPFIDESYKNGILDGELRKYTTLGKLQEVSNYKNGIKHGSSKWYHNANSILSEFVYENGVLVGPSKSYHKNGKLSKEANYADSKLDGNFKSYHSNSKLESEGKYILGEKDGKWTYYDKKGSTTKQEWYKDGEIEKTK
ncbi:MAG: toxin-antitoxin system YwqK family antitoxin [Chitinophagales bacterium]